MSGYMDDLLDSFSLKKSYDNYIDEFGESNQRLLESMKNQLKESFHYGYKIGRQNGFDDGLVEVKLKTMVKLAVHTDLDDQTILKVLEREDDNNFIDSLKQIRRKQSEQN
ncbi:MAG TPA: hypothetical protein VNR61_19665 [Niallia sp.]|nr:hypothetical protein [Niallia sp.]